MIKELKLINFRNFDKLLLESLNKENFIIWENWKWKTNILEAISILWNNSITWIKLNNLVKKWTKNFLIEYINNNWDKISFSYTTDTNKEWQIIAQKRFKLNNNKISKKKFNSITYKCVIFSPITMNMMYLSPNLRRDFLDNILKSSFSEYEQLLLDYKKILKSRNKTLKSIHEWKCSKNEINFWNEKFIELSTLIYRYRFKIINFLQSSISSTAEYFSWKIKNVEFIYNTKVFENNIEIDIKDYINKNIDRDIILWKTHIWPHVDDFEIKIDWVNLINFASRWETKSIIIWLKLLEWIFIEKMTNKKPLLIIDDLISELDKKHKDILFKKIEYYQTFISSIMKKDIKNNAINDSNIIRI